MLAKSFQKLSESQRKGFYKEAKKVIVKLKNDKELASKYPKLMYQLRNGNEAKVGLLKSLINTKINTNLNWDECVVAINDNI